MAEKVVTLYIDDTSVRLLVTSGKRIRKWADLPLEPGLVKNGVVMKQEEVAARIRQLFNIRKVNSNRVVLGVSGLQCLTRPMLLPQLPRDMLEEAVVREAKRVLPVSPDQLYLKWQSIPAPEGKIQVFLVAVPRTAVDALFNTLQLTGLKTDLMDLKPMLLARMVKDTMGIIVDVQPTEFDVVVMAEGIPQPIRTVRFPNKASSWTERTALIKDDVSRTIEFYNTNNPEMPLAATLPVWVSGELANEVEQCQVLSDALSRPVLPLPPPLESPDGLDSSRYIANMGLTLKKIAPTNSSGLLVSELNILPLVYQPEPISLTRILAVPSAVIAVGILLLLGLMIQNTSADIAEIREQVNTTNQLLQQRTAQRQTYSATIDGLNQKIANAETSGGNFALAVSNLETQSHKVNGDLEVTVSLLPETVSLTSISYSNNTLTIKGNASSEEDVLSYLKELEATERFSHITITNFRRTAVDSNDFTIILGMGD
ncbi:MAG TPA: pilus assembly protein PilM [Dehalococcoidia bacterium]|nr:pilus assembly protein PilM [Dehalococcoidia bacterium]